MPYKSRADLPDPVRHVLPPHAQDIYKDAFNNAYARFADPKTLKYGGDRETAAHRVAWFAVKKAYKKSPSGRWVKKT